MTNSKPIPPQRIRLMGKPECASSYGGIFLHGFTTAASVSKFLLRDGFALNKGRQVLGTDFKIIITLPSHKKRQVQTLAHQIPGVIAA